MFFDITLNEPGLVLWHRLETNVSIGRQAVWGRIGSFHEDVGRCKWCIKELIIFLPGSFVVCSMVKVSAFRDWEGFIFSQQLHPWANIDFCLFLKLQLKSEPSSEKPKLQSNHWITNNGTKELSEKKLD